MLFAAEKDPLNVLGVYPSQYFSYNNLPFCMTINAWVSFESIMVIKESGITPLL